MRLSIVNPTFRKGSMEAWKVVARGLDATTIQAEIDKQPVGTRILVDHYGDWEIYDIQPDRSLKKVNGGGKSKRRARVKADLLAALQLARELQLEDRRDGR